MSAARTPREPKRVLALGTPEVLPVGAAGSGRCRPDPRTSWRLPGESVPRMAQTGGGPVARQRRGGFQCRPAGAILEPIDESVCVLVRKRERVRGYPAPLWDRSPGRGRATESAEPWQTGKWFGAAGRGRFRACAGPFCVPLMCRASRRFRDITRSWRYVNKNLPEKSPQTVNSLPSKDFRAALIERFNESHYVYN